MNLYKFLCSCCFNSLNKRNDTICSEEFKWTQKNMIKACDNSIVSMICSLKNVQILFNIFYSINLICVYFDKTR